MSLPQPLRCLVFPASLRHGSLNGRLAALAKRTIETSGDKVDSATMREFDCSSYDGDVQDAEGFPPGAERLRRRLAEADAFVICSPEYNTSMPGALKNAILHAYQDVLGRGSEALGRQPGPQAGGSERSTRKDAADSDSPRSTFLPVRSVKRWAVGRRQPAAIPVLGMLQRLEVVPLADPALDVAAGRM